MNLTEADAGTDVGALKTKATPEKNHYLIRGQKTYITWGEHDCAENIIHPVLARTPDAPEGTKGISLFLVDTSLPGFSTGKKIEKIGQHSSDTAELFFSDLRVPANALLGEEGKGFVYLMEELPRERLGCSTQAVGAAQVAGPDARCQAELRVVGDGQCFGFILETNH